MTAAEAQATWRALPVRDFAAVFGVSPLLILAPHPDDESLACGGTIAEACLRGHDVTVAILTDGAMSHPNSPTWPPDRLIRQRRAEALAATAILGLAPERVMFFDQPDTRAPHDGPAFEAVVERLVMLLRRRRFGTLCASWAGDPHGDHLAAARLAAAACRRAAVRHMAYPVWGWTLAGATEVPRIGGGARIDVGRHLPAKRRAIAAHATQYSTMIDDDPNGFRLPPGFLSLFDGPWEYVFEPAQ